MSCQYIHLRVHSEFSIMNGLVRIEALIQQAVDHKMPAIAITDQSFMSAQIRFYQTAQKAGIKPICGADIWVENLKKPTDPTRLTLLCMNEIGYKHLMELISLSFQYNQHHGKALCKKSWIYEKSEGLIALSGAKEGEIGFILLSQHSDLAHPTLLEWKKHFPDRFYLEIQRTNRIHEETYIQAILPLAAQTNTPLVATNDVLFIDRSDFEAHEIRVCISEGQLLDDLTRKKKYTEEQYFKSPDTMQALFQDIPEAIENTVEIAKRCNIKIHLGIPCLPDFPIPKNLTLDAFFKQIAQKGLQNRLDFLKKNTHPTDLISEDVYQQRLNFEIKMILEMGFAGYFLIVMDFIQWAKNNQIPVGPGRGSGAGSLVAYALNITDLDPMHYELLFERFLNPARVSMPDFDIDFCMENRDRVIEYVTTTYGQAAVSQIITFGTMSAKAVIRDVARVLGKPYSMADKLSKLIPFEIGMTLTKAISQEENIRLFLKQDPNAQETWNKALKLEGLTRNVGKHAGGVVIAPKKLTDFSPIYCDEQGDNLVTQYDKNDVETVGLVKFDFLGLRTLTIIDWTLTLINHNRKKIQLDPIQIESIDLNDKACYDQLKSGETTAIFQLESRGMKELIKRLLPDCFEEIIALVALFRPGPLQSGMVDNFINRKHGREKISYPDPQYQHELLKPILQSTYGIILYQEQVMQIAQQLAGYSLGEADLLRRAMGKKKPEEMAQHRHKFAQGAAAINIHDSLSMKIFDLVEKFAGYGFNKSHSAAYALVSYQTLWLKTHYPAEFIAAVLSADMQNTDKIVTLVEEVKRMDIMILPPNITTSQYSFTVKDHKIIYGLGAIKGIGEGPAETIKLAHKNKTHFNNLFDFYEQLNVKKINKRAMEALIRSGACDLLGPNQADLNLNRAVLLACVEDASKAANQSAESKRAGINDLFNDLKPSQNQHAYDPYLKTTPLTDKERLTGEKETLGLYLTGHPIDSYLNELSHFIPKSLSKLDIKRQTMLAGLIINIRVIRNKRGEKIAFFILDDKSARFSIAVFSDTFQIVQAKLIVGQLIIVEGDISYDEYSGELKALARHVMTLEEARIKYAKAINIKTNQSTCNIKWLESLKKFLLDHQGGLPVQLHYQREKTSIILNLSPTYAIQPSEESMQILNKITNKNSVSVIY
ncbi:MAG: DNA polymerase III subunit alpha [Endozoicomonadaceae bacterium]|nr:DNA polymerase III subunit alpha [Endozoicomonadaceae bacterium]